MDQGVRCVLRFGEFELDLRARQLRKNGSNTGLPEQSIKILEMLLANEGDVVLRDEIRSRLWPDGIVVEFDHSINAAVKRLRQALGDGAETPQFIETLPRRGYRWKPSAEHAVVRSESGAPSRLSDSRTNGNSGDECLESAAQPNPGVGFRVFPRNWLTSLATIGVAASSLLLFTSPRPKQPLVRHQIKQRQLTANPIDNSATSGSISPDGKFLAYGDSKGIHVHRLGTGETRDVPQPTDLPREAASWCVGQWFPDGRGFLANALAAGAMPFDERSNDMSVWIVPAFEGSPRKLRDRAIGYSISPTGDFVAFSTSAGRVGDREIWSIRADGTEARKVVEADDDTALASFVWAPDGRHAAYLARDKSGTRILTRDLQRRTSDIAVASSAEDAIMDLVWPSESRLLYAREEPSNFGTCNLWESRVEPRSGKPAEPPNRITAWVGSCLRGITATANGERVVFTKWDAHFTALLANLKPGASQFLATRRLTTTQSADFPADWTPDGRSVVVWSNRTGRFAVYLQPLSDEAARPLAVGNSDYGFPRVAPDGWVIFAEATKALNSPPLRTMRVAFNGGEPQFVGSSKPDDQIVCSRELRNACVLKELSLDSTQAIFRSFDSVKGAGEELLRLHVDNANYFGWDLSPDGTKLAICKSPRGPVQILSLDGRVLREIESAELQNMRSLDWAADGQAFYIANSAQQRVDLYYVDLSSRARKIWSQQGSKGTFARESPDGRHLALLGFTADTNVWSLEDF